MCLGIPMQITHVEGHIAHCEAKGIQREVNLFLLQDSEPSIGDFVMVHVGYAIQKISSDVAHSAWALYDEMVSKDNSDA